MITLDSQLLENFINLSDLSTNQEENGIFTLNLLPGSIVNLRFLLTSFADPTNPLFCSVNKIKKQLRQQNKQKGLNLKADKSFCPFLKPSCILLSQFFVVEIKFWKLKFYLVDFFKSCFLGKREILI